MKKFALAYNNWFDANGRGLIHLILLLCAKPFYSPINIDAHPFTYVAYTAHPFQSDI